MDWKLEVVTIPVSDVAQSVGDGIRLVQLTPPGSACSVHLGKQTTDMAAGSIDGVFLVVRDLRAARAELVERGVDVGELQIFDEGAYRQAREDESLDLVGCVFFSDPDGNRWCVQQIPARD